MATGTQGTLGSVFSYRQKDSHPGIVPSAAEQFDRILQRRMTERRPAGREYAFDLSE
jgi:hypothetical protein